jgi:16S rRNA (guanine527-N7)-methyltransferase
VSSKAPPSQKPKAGSDKESKNKEASEGNALWRVPEWFPQLAEEKLMLLKLYHSELLRFNARVNLISRGTEREADEIHFADSLMAGELLLQRPMAKRVFDLGSGNGLPGLIMAILDDSREYFLVESDARKSEFLKHIIHLLKLKNAAIMNVRFENLKENQIEAAISRGLASISKAVLVSNRVFPVGGVFFHLKGSSWSSEVAELPSQVISVWRPELVGEYVLPASQQRRAIVSTQKIR